LGFLDADTKLHAQYLLAQFKLESRMHDPVSALSAGELQCVHLARALVCKPNLVLLDNPTKGLAPKDQQRLKEILFDIKHQMIMTMIVATSNPRFAVTACEQVLCLNQSQVWQGEAKALNKETVTKLFGCDVDFRKQPKRRNPRNQKPKQSDSASELESQPKTINLPEL
jgi:ABC-type Mn2+/Zn2+ transport system ATPase subunit